MVAVSDLPQIRKLPEKNNALGWEESVDCKFTALKRSQGKLRF